ELEKEINAAETLSKLEDLYLPYKPKRRTKATVAKEKGLAPLADVLLAQQAADVFAEAEKFVNAGLQVNTAEEALQGARDIVAEMISEDPGARDILRDQYKRSGIIRSRVIKGQEEAGEKFADYFEWEEKLSECPSHRMLAMRRGEKENVLIIDLAIDAETTIPLLEKKFITGRGACAAQLKDAIADGYKRLLQ